jgi:hypothetical protein
MSTDLDYFLDKGVVNLIFVNQDYGNEATLGEDDLGESLSAITWRELIEECLGQTIKQEFLEMDFGIKYSELDNQLNDLAVDKYFETLRYRYDNLTGPGAKAYELIKSLNLFPTNRQGNGSFNGVSLEQTFGNGPKRRAYIESQESSDWLVERAAERGLKFRIVFV